MLKVIKSNTLNVSFINFKVSLILVNNLVLVPFGSVIVASEHFPSDYYVTFTYMHNYWKKVHYSLP